MDLHFTEGGTAFRNEVRDFVRTNRPSNTRERLRLGYPRSESRPSWRVWRKG